jgi:hypothetical protein
MSLWHTDWYLIEDDRWRGKWFIAYLDDASRFIVGYGIFDGWYLIEDPQTNGKIERFYETFQSKIHHFNSMEEFVIWYNTKRPHMSLNWDQLETPVQAFYKKIDRRRKQLPFIINI